jgi:putative oxidoreductase
MRAAEVSYRNELGQVIPRDELAEMNKESRARLERILLLVGRLVLAGIFLYAAYAKMRPQPGMPWAVGSIRVSLSLFAMGVDSYQMLPPWAVSPLAHLLPPFEFVLGLWILSGIALRYAALVASLLLTVFFSAMVRAYVLHLGISCGCFGPGEQIGPKRLVEEGLEFLPLAFAVTIGAFLMNRKPRDS